MHPQALLFLRQGFFFGQIGQIPENLLDIRSEMCYTYFIYFI